MKDKRKTIPARNEEKLIERCAAVLKENGAKPRTEAIGRNYNLEEANLVSGMSLLEWASWEKVLLQPIKD